VSAEAKEFISKMIKIDPKERMSPEKAIEHDWIKLKDEKEELDIGVLKRLKKFRQRHRLQKEMLLVLINSLSYKELKKMRDTFEAMDTSYSGLLDTS
jgi:calcium-dependent protein kinase